MQLVDQDDSSATITFSQHELALVYGAIVEAMEALSPEEFLARTGQREQDAERLLGQIKPLTRPAEGPS
jgi:hypothetical protein